MQCTFDKGGCGLLPVTQIHRPLEKGHTIQVRRENALAENCQQFQTQALGALFQRLLDALAADNAFPPLAGDSQPVPASPQAQLWTMVYLAQHHDRMGDTGGRLRMAGMAEASASSIRVKSLTIASPCAPVLDIAAQEPPYPEPHFALESTAEWRHMQHMSVPF